MSMIFMGIMVQMLLVVLASVLLVTDGRQGERYKEVGGLKWDNKRLAKSACKGFGIGACAGAWGCATHLDWSLEVRYLLLDSKLHFFSLSYRPVFILFFTRNPECILYIALC